MAMGCPPPSHSAPFAFQSAAGPKARPYETTVARHAVPLEVSIRGRAEGPAVRTVACGVGHRDRVSIRGRAEGPAVQTHSLMGGEEVWVSIRGRAEGPAVPMVECLVLTDAEVSIRGRAEGPAVPPCQPGLRRRSVVSIRGRAEGPAVRLLARQQPRLAGVSIRGRAEGPAVPTGSGQGHGSKVFQSAAGPKARPYKGCAQACAAASRFQSAAGPKARPYFSSAARPGRSMCFNPRPGRRPGRTRARIQVGVLDRVSIRGRAEGPAVLIGLREIISRLEVSIRGRAEGPAVPDEAARSRALPSVSIRGRAEGPAVPGKRDGLMAAYKFQSAAGPKARPYAVVRGDGGTPTGCFNPRPGRRPGRTVWYSNSWNAGVLFQSAAGPKARPYPSAGERLRPFGGVSIRGRAEGPAVLHWAALRSDWENVSIRGRAEGPAVRSSGGSQGPSNIGFNPRPGRRPGRTTLPSAHRVCP